jgi:hypothetical protein
MSFAGQLIHWTMMETKSSVCTLMSKMICKTVEVMLDIVLEFLCDVDLRLFKNLEVGRCNRKAS